jgi:hypothetical protein
MRSSLTIDNYLDRSGLALVTGHLEGRYGIGQVEAVRNQGLDFYLSA